MKTLNFCCGFAVFLALAGSAAGNGFKLSGEELACVPLEGSHAVTYATIEPAPPEDHTPQVCFRRLHAEVEDFYCTEMFLGDDGRHWGLLPDPENRRLTERALEGKFSTDDAAAASETEWADWWKAKEACHAQNVQSQGTTPACTRDRDPDGNLELEVIRERSQFGSRKGRDWMEAMSRSDLQSFLANLENRQEPVEYYFRIVDAQGTLVSEGPLEVSEVKEDCPVELTDEQEEKADELTVFETADWQSDLSIFHWECDHVDSRVDPRMQKRDDGVCAVLAVPPVFLTGLAAAGGSVVVLGDDVINDDSPEPVSPSAP